MCGIAGIMTSDAAAPRDEVLLRMIEIMRHRGPDDMDMWSAPHIGLGFCRLSIVDVEAGRQPISNEDGSVWLVFNGEIYNYRTLRAQLQARGHQFSTSSDSEVIVHLYEEYGADCVKRLQGMFAFVIWDSGQQQLLGARDPFGIKPFYYTARDHSLLFASEIKSLLSAASKPGAMDLESLRHYLTFQYVPDPMTMFEGISKLPPAHLLIARPGGSVRLERYWEGAFNSQKRPLSEWSEQIRAALDSSVGRHLSGDVEAGCFLSSGIDSTAIAALMRQRGMVKTFSVGFDGESNETIWAARTAEALGTEHYSKVISEAEYFDSIPQAVWQQDEPVADPSAIAVYHLAELASNHVKVVLSGEGADELFGGYRIYREPASLAPIAWLPDNLRRVLHRLAGRLPEGMKGRSYLLRGTTPLEQRFRGNASIFTEQMKHELLQPSWWSEEPPNPDKIVARLYASTRHLDAVARMQHIDLNLWLPGNILMKADKMSMAHSLELRVPFLDTEVFALAAELPRQLKTAKGTTKYALRRALEDVVPPFIVHRPKLGFPVPLRRWLAGPRGVELLEQIDGSGIGSYIRSDYVHEMLRRHRQGQGDYSRRLYTLYILALWHDSYIRSFGRISTDELVRRERIAPVLPGESSLSTTAL